MTEELFANVLGILRSVLPPRESEVENVETARPLWNQLVSVEAVRNPESVEIMLLLSLVLLAYYQQGDIKKIKEITERSDEHGDIRRIREVLDRLDGKELDTGIRVKIATGGPPSLQSTVVSPQSAVVNPQSAAPNPQSTALSPESVTLSLRSAVSSLPEPKLQKAQPARGGRELPVKSGLKRTPKPGV